MKDKEIEQLFFLQRDITLGVRDGRIVFFNAAAKEQFPDLKPGEPASSLLPIGVLEAREETFVGNAFLGEKPYTVLATQMGNLWIYSLILQEIPGERERQLFENVCASMRRTLTVLNMATEFLAPAITQLGDQGQHANLKILNKSYYQLERLCDNLDHFFRLQDGEGHLHLESVDLVRHCRDLAQSVNHFTSKQGVSLTFQTDTEQLLCVLDRPKITKLLLNLISNSLSRIDDAGSLSLELSLRGDDLLLALRDTGSGIPPEDIPHIFEQCRRNQSAFRSGIGLGLSISREIAQLHGGTLLLTSQEGRGTTVFVQLPIRQLEGGGQLQEIALPYSRDDEGLRPILLELSDVLDDTAFQGLYLD